MKRTCLFHISGNQYAPFPARHHTRRIWDELAKGFDEYHVFARGRENRYLHSVEGKIHLNLLPACGKRMWPFFFLSWLLPWFIVRYRPTHLLAQCPVLGGLAAALCSKLFRIPLFVELHGTHYFYPSKSGWKGAVEFAINRGVTGITLRLATRIRSLSDDMSDYIEKVYGKGMLRKICVIHNRVDLDVFRHIKSNYALGAPVKIITVGNYSPTKNHGALMKAIHGSGIDFHLTIVGSGRLKDVYLGLMKEIGLENKVELISLDHDTLASLLPQHDLYIHYSLSEGVSRAILEAMAAGLPVIATRVGFIRGILCHGENALLIEMPYAEKLAESMNCLIVSDELRKNIGVAARSTIETYFEWNHVFDRYRTAITSMSMQG